MSRHDQGYTFKVVTKIEDEKGQDIFTMRRGAGEQQG